MNKQEKSTEIDTLKGILAGGPTTFVVAPKGLTVNQVSALRRKVRAGQGRFKVIKNRLALRAIKGTPYESLAPHMKGETAIAYSTADPAPLAKVIGDFSKDNQGLTIKGGVVDGRLVSAAEIRTIADMPPRPVLLARLLGVMQQPMIRLLTVLQGPARGLVRAMDEIARKKESGGAAPAGPEAPAS
jgi:large subunit ribosomal protein L10